jgi:hypothetical protein
MRTLPRNNHAADAARGKQGYFYPAASIGFPQQTNTPAPAAVTWTSLPQILHLYFSPTFVIVNHLLAARDPAAFLLFVNIHADFYS